MPALRKAPDMAPAPSHPADLVGLADVARLAGVHYRTARRWIAAGLLPAQRVGPKLLRVRRPDLDAFLAGGR